jgi:coenzyme F420-reducing hydrogenase beta subunit
MKNNIVLAERKYCTGCLACYNACIKQCIEVISDGEGFYYPQINEFACIKCAICENICPIIKHENERCGTGNIPDSFAVINQNTDVLFDSSSGGAFTLLAEQTIQQGGVVFGARFDEKFKVIHSYTNTLEGLADFRGSKYVQSDIGNSYKEVKTFLQNKREVLFSGTPCQIGGLKSYLKDIDTSLLICVDLICYGVPSPKIWEKYYEFIVKKEFNGQKITGIKFRDKANGWSKNLFSITSEYKFLLQNSRSNFFKRIFSNRLSIRPSCFDCRYKFLSRRADISIGDFWGIENIFPALPANNGVSCVIIHTDVGNNLFDKIKKCAIVKKSDINVVMQYNPFYTVSVRIPILRDIFMKDFQSYNFYILMKKWELILAVIGCYRFMIHKLKTLFTKNVFLR